MKRMIKHLRKNWFRYGLETLVVIIGILVAFALNNWNEKIKKENKAVSYVESLINDLKQDTLQLSRQVRYMQIMVETLNQFSNRLSSPRATIDTLIQIARYEFKPYFDPSNSINNTTYMSLQNNGDIDLLESWLIKELMRLNSGQNATVRIVERNFDIYLDKVNRYWSSFSIDEQRSAIKGPLLNEAWKNIDPNELTVSFNALLTSKMTMLWIVRDTRQNLLDETTTLLKYLTSKY